MGRHIPDDGKITGAANKYLQVKTMVPFNFPLNQCSMRIVSSDFGIGFDWIGSKSLTVFMLLMVGASVIAAS